MSSALQCSDVNISVNGMAHVSLNTPQNYPGYQAGPVTGLACFPYKQALGRLMFHFYIFLQPTKQFSHLGIKMANATCVITVPSNVVFVCPVLNQKLSLGDHSIITKHYEIGLAFAWVTRRCPCGLHPHGHRRVSSTIRQSSDYVN